MELCRVLADVPDILEPIREVWIHDEVFAASRLSMMRIMARRMNAATVVAFEVASQATVTTDPRERSFDDPPFRQHLKSSSVRSLDDLQALGTSAPHRHRHLASRVSAVSKNVFDERE